jgi:hypothetical protein
VEFRQLLAKYVSGNLSSNQVPEMSYVAFEEGYESPSLWILAGLEKNEDQYIIDKYLQLSVNEMGIEIPDKRNATLQYANALAGEVIKEERDLIAGIEEIIRVLKNYNFESETQQFVFDSIFFQRVYGEYCQYEDLMDSIVDWKSNEELIKDFKVELLNELKAWNEKMSPYLNK